MGATTSSGDVNRRNRMTLVVDENNYLAHYGVLRRSGRYPWGSGGPEKASNRSFLDYVDELKRGGMSDVEIVKAMGLESTTQLRAAKSIAKNEERAADIALVQKYSDLKRWVATNLQFEPFELKALRIRRIALLVFRTFFVNRLILEVTSTLVPEQNMILELVSVVR
jgi:hypothetical protein